MLKFIQKIRSNFSGSKKASFCLKVLLSDALTLHGFSYDDAIASYRQKVRNFAKFGKTGRKRKEALTLREIFDQPWDPEIISVNTRGPRRGVCVQQISRLVSAESACYAILMEKLLLVHEQIECSSVAVCTDAAANVFAIYEHAFDGFGKFDLILEGSLTFSRRQTQHLLPLIIAR